MPRTLLGWSTLSGHLSEPPFTKSWIYPSCVSACWHVCLTTCVPVRTSECLHVCVWMTACLHFCRSISVSACLHLLVCACLCVCMTAYMYMSLMCLRARKRVLCLHVCVSGWLGKKTHCGLGLVMEVWHVAPPCLLIFDPVVHTSRFFFLLLLSGSSWIWTLGKRRKIITYKKSSSNRGSYNHFRKHTILKEIY